MRVLAVETSSFSGSTAVLENGRVLGEVVLAAYQRTAQALAPAVADVLRQVGWEAADIELVAVAQGPGSFTGLRVGVTTAKVLAYAIGAEVIGVDTLEVIAEQAPATAHWIVPVLDAQRQQLFAACWSRGSHGRLQCVQGTHVTERTTLLERLPPDACLTGAGLRAIRSVVPAGIQVAPEEVWTPRAATVGQLAYGRYAAGQRQDFWKLVPQYYRKSAAEEKG